MARSRARRFTSGSSKATSCRKRYHKTGNSFTGGATGSRTVVKHPTLSAEEIEDLQRWCFNEDFQRLGPSIFRTLEARLLGYQKLKNSPNVFLRRKAEFYARELRESYPAFLAGRLLGPNAAVRRWVGNLENGSMPSWARPLWPPGSGP